jgi:hypothetical protein
VLDVKDSNAYNERRLSYRHILYTELSLLRLTFGHFVRVEDLPLVLSHEQPVAPQVLESYPAGLELLLLEVA